MERTKNVKVTETVINIPNYERMSNEEKSRNYEAAKARLVGKLLQQANIMGLNSQWKLVDGGITVERKLDLSLDIVGILTYEVPEKDRDAPPHMVIPGSTVG